MPNSVSDSEAFVSASRHALDKVYESLVLRREALDKIDARVAELDSVIQREHEWFFHQGQWEPNPNWHFIQMHKRLQGIKARKDALGDDAARQAELGRLMAEFGATEQSISILAGAVLQLGKQVLSFRFGGKGAVPAGARSVGSQSVVEVIWEGRNHAMHWEEGSQKQPVRDMFATLKADGLIHLVPGENNSAEIVSVLGWDSAASVEAELLDLVRLT